ncbi:MAG: hypothetical protein M3Y09_14405 [Actinomycetota bacterium]|nr:hypothetical protein [Actinomycetota bacterium]
MAVDEAVIDGRFDAGGEFADYNFSALASSSGVERRVRDRYLELAATNDDHFVAPGGVTHERRTRPFGSAGLAYHHFHQVALDEACRLARIGGDRTHAMAREAAAQHFLTDAFAAGHLRTPVAQIRRFWRARYPDFWENLQHQVAARTAQALRELTWPLRLLPARFLNASTLSTLQTRTSRYPDLSLGDFLARLFHDWDNNHGLTLEDGDIVFGDGQIHQGATRELALAAVRAGINDIEVAIELGASGSRLSGDPLYRAVRAATGAPETSFLAEMKIPWPSPANAPQNWRATDLETLWTTTMVGTTGATVGEALTEMMRPDGYFIRQLDRLGQGLAEPHGLLAMPVFGDWLSDQGRHAYHHGFINPLTAHPKQVILAVLNELPPLSNGTIAAGSATSTDI